MNLSWDTARSSEVQSWIDPDGIIAHHQQVIDRHARRNGSYRMLRAGGGQRAETDRRQTVKGKDDGLSCRSQSLRNESMMN